MAEPMRRSPARAIYAHRRAGVGWRRRSPLAAAALALCLSISAPTRSRAQETAAPAVEATPTPGALPGGRIAEGLEDSRRQLQALQADVAADPRVAAIEAGLGTLVEEVQRLDAQMRRDATVDASVAVLTDVESRWNAIQDRLQNWQRSLTEDVSAMEAGLTQLRDIAQRWEETRAAGLANQVPAELTDRIASLLTMIDEAQQQRRARRAQLLALQGKIAQQQLLADEGLGYVRERRTEQRGRLLLSESPPLWRALEGTTGRTLGTELAQAWKQNVRTLLLFVNQAPQRLLAHGVMFLVIVVSLVWLRGRVPEAGEEATAESMRILARPGSAAFLIALALLPWFHPLAPVPFRRLGALLVTVPIFRLLPAGLSGPRRLGLLTLTVAYVLSQVGEMTVSFTLLERLLLIAQILLTGVALRRFSTASDQPRVVGQPRPVVVRGVCGLGLVLLAVALGANVVGNVGLARTLAYATVVSTYTGVILVAAVMVFDAILVAFFRARVTHVSRIVRAHGAWLRPRIVRAVQLAFMLLWLNLTLRVTQVSDGLSSTFLAVVSTNWSFGSVEMSVGGVLRFVLILWVAVLVARALRFVLQEEILPRVALRPGVPVAIVTGVHYVVVAAGFLLAVAAAGVDFGHLAILAGALSVGLGFGLQNVVNNFVSGIILLFERPITIGDTIEVGTVLGEVRRIGIRSSTIRTYEGAEVIVPNGMLISDRLINWTYSDRQRRVELPIGVAYGTDPQRVIELLVGVATAQSGVLKVPQPTALFTAFGDSSLNFSLRFWTGEFEDSVNVRSNVAVAVSRALQDAGIEVPFPQRDVHVRSVDGVVAGAASPEERTRDESVRDRLQRTSGPGGRSS